MRNIRGSSRCTALAIAVACLACLFAPSITLAQVSDDRQVSQEALAELARAGKDGNYAALERQTEAMIFRRLSAGGLDRLGALNDLVFVLRSSRYLPMALRLEEGKKLASWLADHRDVTRLLWRAMQDVKGPEDALKKFQTILSADEKKTLAYANLAVAFATAQPLAHYMKQPKPASMMEAFGFYTDARNTFRHDLKTMPFEFSRYLADTQLSLAERQWAQKRYASNGDLPGVYFQVQYDFDYFYRGAPKKLSHAEYTLPNILSIGGICMDQAYFVSEVCKAMGVPATIVSGQTAGGDPHAWLACLKIHKAQADWDAQTGRYPEYKFYTGMVTDPASGTRLHDSELALLGSAAMLPLDRREEADAATALAERVAEAAKTRPPDLPAAIKIDPAWVEKLIFEAVNRNLAHRQAWELVVRLGKAGEISTETLDRLFDFLVGRTAKDYPDYSCTLILQKCVDLYARRPDLQAQMLIALGDEYVSQGKKDLALAAYKRVTSSKLREQTEVVLIAAKHTEDLLLADKRRDQAIALYRQLFTDTPRPDFSGGYQQTAYYQLGKRLADLLTEDSQADAARKVLEKISAKNLPRSAG